MRWLYLLCLISIGCESDFQWEAIDVSPTLHDNSSKVWIIDKEITKTGNKAPLRNADKHVIVFLNSGKWYVQPMNRLGEIPWKKGQFLVDSEKLILTLFSGSSEWNFKMKEIGNQGLRLIPLKGNDMPLRNTLEIIPFPEF
jgi:hypothetical protein